MDIALGMCYAPRRVDTLNRTLESIRKRYNGTIHIAAEPLNGAYPIQHIKDGNIEMQIAKEKQGCFKNHDRLIRRLLSKNTKYILILQDDFVYHDSMGDEIREAIKYQESLKPRYDTELQIKKPNFGYYCFYTNEMYRGVIRQIGRNEIPVKFTTAFQVSYLMHRDILEMVINHKFYKNHLENYVKNQQVDACISETLSQMKMPMYFHNPSLSMHIGSEYSTLGHSHKKDETFNSFKV